METINVPELAQLTARSVRVTSHRRLKRANDMAGKEKQFVILWAFSEVHASTGRRSVSVDLIVKAVKAMQPDLWPEATDRRCETEVRWVLRLWNVKHEMVDGGRGYYLNREYVR